MGLFYTNFTVYGSDQANLVGALKKLRKKSFISPPMGRFTVIYEQETEDQNFGKIEKFGARVSELCASPVLAAVLHDDDVLYLWLFQGGECRDFYDSLPQYFDSVAEPGPPEGGNSSVICKAFGCPRKSKRVNSLLRADLLNDETPEVPGELERHQALIKELGMPAFAAGVTYSSIKGNYLPDEFRGIRFVAV